MAVAESAAFSGAEVLTSHSVLGDFGACGAGVVGSITSTGTDEIATVKGKRKNPGETN